VQAHQQIIYEELIVKPTNHPELLIEIEKQVLLRSIDTLWIEHLVAIDYLRTGIGLRGYGQRDPLVEYKKETFHMFNELMSLIQKEVVYTIFKVSVGIQLAPTMMEAAFSPNAPAQGKVEFSGAENTVDVQPIPEAAKAAAQAGGQPREVGRNDLCYCGSGKKFKKCHGV
jgi:preprotein translocase subunit SecA